MAKQFVAILLLCLLAGHEAARIDTMSSIASKSLTPQRQKDLDWSGCGEKSGALGKDCSKVEGCHWHKLWLDTPRQSCRFTDDYKLARERVSTYLPVELARLEYKTWKFSKQGCLMSGMFGKCYRRTFQILRLSNYVRKAMEQVRKDSTHPAYGFVTSESTTKSLDSVAQYLAQGFAKHKSNGPAVDFGGAFKHLRNAQTEVKAVGNISDQEKANMEKTATTAAMLSMLDIDVSEEQRAHLYAVVEAESDGDNPSTDAVFDEQVDAIDGMFEDTDTDALGSIITQEHEDFDDKDDEDLFDEDADDDEDDDDEPEEFSDIEGDDDAEESSSTGSGELTEGSDEDSETSENSLVEVAKHGALAQTSEKVGPLKWMFKHGLGWIVARVAWLVMFSVGAALGIIRGVVVFPLLFVSCLLMKFASWLFVDFGYDFLWEGNTAFLGNFAKIGQCAPAMWDAVGFDSSAKNTAAQIFVQPAWFASEVTGVRHLYQSQKSLCESVQCGKNAMCIAGQCSCNAGFYPPRQGESPYDCVTADTEAGCKCNSYWVKQQHLGMWSTSHFGCPAGKAKCAVDITDPSYTTCRQQLATLPQRNPLRDMAEWALGTNTVLVTDRCQPMASRGKVPAVSTGKK